MQILFVTNYFEPDAGEAATRLMTFARKLTTRGHQVTVLTSLPHYPQGEVLDGYRGKFSVTETREGIRVIYAWLWVTKSPKVSRKLPSQVSFMLSGSLRGLPIAKPDVVVIEAQPIFTSLAGVFLAKLKRAPYVLNVSDLWPDHMLSLGTFKANDFAYRMARRLVDSTYRGASAITVMSPFWGRRIEGYINRQPPQGIHTIYRGCDLEQFHPDVAHADFRAKHGLGDEKLITFIGTFATQYNFDDMLAVARHFNAREDVRVVFIGQGSQNETLENAMQQPDFSRMKWIRWVDPQDMPAVWCASQLNFWAMGGHELYTGTIPAKIFEALACGTPVAAANGGEAAAIIEASQCGIAVAPGDVNSLIAGIEQLVDDVAYRQACAVAGRTYAEAHYDPDKIFDYHAGILEGVGGR